MTGKNIWVRFHSQKASYPRVERVEKNQQSKRTEVHGKAGKSYEQSFHRNGQIDGSQTQTCLST